MSATGMNKRERFEAMSDADKFRWLETQVSGLTADVQQLRAQVALLSALAVRAGVPAAGLDPSRAGDAATADALERLAEALGGCPADVPAAIRRGQPS
jgi:hypothetical protein